MNKNIYNIILLLYVIAGSKALKDVTVNVPMAARIMDTVTLQCKYDLEGDDLYTVKWYKGTKEFYRYIPKELPSTQVFPLPGIDVDLSKSNPNEVVLRNVQPEVSGKYKCEVSSDAPHFYTRMMASNMHVIDVPVDDPVISIEKELVEIGSTIKGNCTSPPSYPPINITWYLNGKKLNSSSRPILEPFNILTNTTVATKTRKQPVRTISNVELEIDGNTFEGGKARLQCVANLFNLYTRKVERIFDEDRPRPRPSSVLGSRDTASDSTIFTAHPLINAVFLLFIILR